MRYLYMQKSFPWNQKIMKTKIYLYAPPAHCVTTLYLDRGAIAIRDQKFSSTDKCTSLKYEWSPPGKKIKNFIDVQLPKMNVTPLN